MSETGSEISVVSLEALLGNLENNTMLDYMMMNTPQPKIKIEKGYRVPPGSLETRTFLDFLMVVTNKLDFAVMKEMLYSFKFYPKYSAKKLPKKYFNEFNPVGHTFYIGKYSDLDVYIVSEPLVDCGCMKKCTDLGTSGCMLDEIRLIVMEEVLLLALSQINPIVLNGRNITVSENYENFTQETFTEFDIFDFDERFLESLRTSWNQIDHEFFRTHKPKLCFTRFGQNTQINGEVV